MEIILQEEVTALGHEGDVVTVARGFASNYLIPKGIAVRATKGNLKQLEQKRSVIAKRFEAAQADAKALAKKLNDKSVTINAKAGEEGRLYGSVTVKDIAAAIQEELGVEIDRRRILTAEPIKAAGEVTVRIRLQANVEVSLGVKVVAEQAEGMGSIEEAAEEPAPEDTEATE